MATVYPSLTVGSITHESGTKWSIIHGPLSINDGLHSPFYNPRIVLKLASKRSQTVSYTFEVNLYPLLTGQLPSDIERFSSLVASLIPGSRYRLCTGLPQDLDKTDEIERKSVRKWGLPFNRTDHKDCQLWFVCEARETSRCPKCTKMSYYLRQQIKKRAMLSPEQKLKRTLPSSKCPYRALSPASARKRLQKVRQTKKFQEKKDQS